MYDERVKREALAILREAWAETTQGGASERRALDPGVAANDVPAVQSPDPALAEGACTSSLAGGVREPYEALNPAVRTSDQAVFRATAPDRAQQHKRETTDSDHDAAEGGMSLPSLLIVWAAVNAIWTWIYLSDLGGRLPSGPEGILYAFLIAASSLPLVKALFRSALSYLAPRYSIW